MSIPQKSLFSLLSLCQNFLQSVEIWQSYDKKYVCTVFLRHGVLIISICFVLFNYSYSYSYLAEYAETTIRYGTSLLVTSGSCAVGPPFWALQCIWF